MSEKSSTLSIDEQLLQNAVSPKSVEIDGQRIEQHSIADQIAACKFAASVRASKSRSRGFRISKMIPGGAE